MIIEKKDGIIKEKSEKLAREERTTAYGDGQAYSVFSEQRTFGAEA
jgi:hypothetical protein